MKTLSWDAASRFFSRVYLSDNFTSNRYVQVAFLLLGIGMVVGAYFLKDVASGLSSVGYPGVFFLSLLGSASMILPVPGLISLCTVSAILNPFTLGLLAAIGETIGEVTGYAVGFGGKGLLDKSRVYRWVKNWMEKRGGLVIFIVSVIPNPLFLLLWYSSFALGRLISDGIIFLHHNESGSLLMCIYSAVAQW